MAATATLASVAMLVLGFHTIPVPDDVSVQSTFSLQGFVSDTDHTVVDQPGFDPETDTLRPSARVSFVAPATGLCVLAETETVDGKTQYAITGRIDATAGERVFRRAVLLTADDLSGDNWQAAVKQRYRIVAACMKDDQLMWSSFYEVPIPANTAQL
jgi:hypothetical protein